MSRSRRKNPILGHTTCHSERDDKQIWHKRMRAQERTALSSARVIEDFESHLPLLENQVSDVWCMGKDGKQYWPITRQVVVAEGVSQRKGKTFKERSSLKLRQLQKWMGK